MKISLEEYEKLLDRIEELRTENDKLQESISTAQDWISVEDRLPNCNGCYIVFIPHYYDKDHGIVTMCYFDGIDTWHDDDRVNFERILNPTFVTYWMPLPEPPEAEDE